MRIEGDAPWLAQAQLPQDQQANLSIHVSTAEREPAANELLIYPKSVVALVSDDIADLPEAIRQALRRAKIAVAIVGVPVGRRSADGQSDAA